MISENRVLELFQMPKNIGVLGDVMIDEYLWGKVSRISPEAPVPIIEIDQEHLRPGGSANVANNLLGLGQNVYIFGVTGKDRKAEQLEKILKNKKIDVSGLIKDDSRNTTVKTRIIGGSQHIARVDKETTNTINKKIEDEIFAQISNKISVLDAIIFEDYNKGVLSPNLIEKVINLCNSNDVIITVDPKFNNFFKYKNVTLFKPNEKEASNALNYQLSDENKIKQAGNELLEKLQSKFLLITLGSRGMAIFTKNQNPLFLPTKVKDVADVSGAGDTVISTVTSVLANGGNAEEAVKTATIAAGIACSKVGAVSVTVSQIVDYLKLQNN